MNITLKIKSMVKGGICIIAIFIGILYLPLVSFSQGSGKRPPNIILCMADDMGWGDTGYNGNRDIKTPNLDEMAAKGVQFNRFYAAAPICSPTRGSVLTGRNPYRYGIYSANVGHLKKEEITLAELLKEEGYMTGHFGKWHLGTFSPDFSGKGGGRNPKKNYMTPGMAGFEEWFSTEFSVATFDPYKKENAHSDEWKINNDWRAMYWHNGEPVTHEISGDDSEILMDRALAFMDKAVKMNKPFFLVIWFHAPHEPVVGNPKYMKELYSSYSENEQHYFSVITSLDAQMGRLRAKIKESGIEENTLLTFNSDNGPEGRMNKVGRNQGSAGNLRGRKASIYEGGIRVPGIVQFPSVFKKHQEINTPVNTSDFFPTICSLLGIDMEKFRRPYDGESIFNITKNNSRKYPMGFQFGNQKAWVENSYKLVYNDLSKGKSQDNRRIPLEEYELYNIDADPSETKNIIKANVAIADGMKERLHKWVESCSNSDRGNDY